VNSYFEQHVQINMSIHIL